MLAGIPNRSRESSPFARTRGNEARQAYFTGFVLARNSNAWLGLLVAIITFAEPASPHAALAQVNDLGGVVISIDDVGVIAVAPFTPSYQLTEGRRGILVRRSGETDSMSILPPSRGDADVKRVDELDALTGRASPMDSMVVGPAHQRLFHLDELIEPNIDPQLTPERKELASTLWTLNRGVGSKYLDELASLTGNRTDPLYLLIESDCLLERQIQSASQQNLADAQSLVQRAGSSGVAEYLRHRRNRLAAAFEHGKPAAGAVNDAATVDGLVVYARRLIASGQWQKALDTTSSLDRFKDDHAHAMAALLRGVIYAEDDLQEDAGAAPAGPAAHFKDAIEALADGPRRDQVFAHGAYGDYLLRLAEDLLNDDAFCNAPRVPHPLLASLHNWLAARDAYDRALVLCNENDDRDSMQINLARAYCLLADIIRTLNATSAADARVVSDCRRAAERRAAELAEHVANRSNDAAANPELVGAGHQILAHLRFRAGDDARCVELAGEAEEAYLAAGSLPGLESVHRLLGLAYYRVANDNSGIVKSAPLGDKALQHLLIAHLIADLLRDRFPADCTGLTRAGFFARRAYVTERIVDLLVAKGRCADALRYAESAKARALEDALASRPLRYSRRAAAPHEMLKELARWPSGIAALEYFIGSEKAWLFVVDATGAVRAFELRDASNTSLVSGDLVTRLGDFLAANRGQAVKMKQRLAAGRGFDHSWQQVLHRFRQELLPEAAFDLVSDAKLVVLVPHHILHYFPFAALVTAPDRTRRESDEMVQPRFLIDEGVDLCYAPSLATWLELRTEPLVPLRQAAAVAVPHHPGARAIPGALEDVKGLQAAFGDKVAASLIGIQARKSKAQELLAQPGICLFATHGADVADNPLESFLLFYSDEYNDGRLRAGELFKASIAADLVVLSACFSGVADRSPLRGDDLFGLQRALLHSGAQTVVSSQWDVYDDTGPKVTRRFFSELAAGVAVPQALAHSQRAMLADLRNSGQVEPWIHPYFWAVFTVSGDDRTRIADSPTGAAPSHTTNRCAARGCLPN